MSMNLPLGFGNNSEKTEVAKKVVKMNLHG